MKKTFVQVNIQDFPQLLHPYIQGYNIYDSSSHSNAKVYYSDSGFYIKIDKKGELQREAELTFMFHQIGYGTEVVMYLSENKDYLVTKEVQGQDCTHFLDDPEECCHLLAQILRNLHSQPVSHFPVSLSMERYKESSQSFENGSYDPSVQMKRYPIPNKEEAWKIIQENKHRLQSDTLIHGDFCLPNIILHDHQFSSLIDFQLSGIGDKHIDLYWAIWSLEYNFKTDKYTDLFLDLYGRDNFEEDMLRVICAFEVFG